MLKIEHLTKAYAKSSVKALDDLNLELKEGEIFGFLGPNGAGKTTTIKILTGILPFEEGKVSICGHDVKTDAIAAKKVSDMFPTRILFTINLRVANTLILWRIFTALI